MGIKIFELAEIINKLELYEQKETDISTKVHYASAINTVLNILRNERLKTNHCKIIKM
jgi:hypothetical protein